MNILFINNWNINNGLTISTTFPSLEVLSKAKNINKIYLVTPEYDKNNIIETNIGKVTHIPIDLSMCTKNKILKYICYEKVQKSILKNICLDKRIDIIIARGAQAGGRAEQLSKKFNIPFYVESFEPHSEYMIEGGVWKKYDPRYILQKQWENKIIKNATGIIPVAKNYENYLNFLGVDKKRLATVPCTVDIESFSFSKEKRSNIRKELNISDETIIGIYVGKFGDIYYDTDAYEAFDIAFKEIENFNLIILTPQKKEDIEKNLSTYKNIDLKRVHIRFVSHDEVPSYLSASDFAYEFHKAMPNTQYCSPIKVGEYWANGLAIIISKGVGDDAELIKKHTAGSLYDIEQKNNSENIKETLESIKVHDREYFVSLAKKYRNRSLIKDAYLQLGIIDE